MDSYAQQLIQPDRPQSASLQPYRLQRGCRALMSTTEETMKALARKTFHKLRAFRARRINKLDFRVTFPRLLKNLKRIHGTDAALKWAVGGEFEAIGFLELEVLKYFGLKEDDYVVDVGCGSGRLAKPLSQYLKGRYLGIDIVPELINHARRIVGCPDWRVVLVEGLSISEDDGVAVMFLFFYVLTH